MSTDHSRVTYQAFGEVAPAAYAALVALGKAVDDHGLDKSLTELVKLRVSQINGCAFCVQHHLNVARRAGVSAAKLDLVVTWTDAGLFSARECAALAWAECLTALATQGAPDDAYSALRAVHGNRSNLPDRRDRHHQPLEPSRRRLALRATAFARGGRDMSLATNAQEAGAASMIPPDLRYADTEAAVSACYGLMAQLRPHLASEEAFVTRWRRQVAAGYRLLALWQAARPIALAGFRVQENLVHGRHFYVDDLVTDETARSSGHGRVLIHRLKAEGRALGCAKLVLDTPLTNTLGHRFYYRHGLVATALRFNVPLD